MKLHFFIPIEKMMKPRGKKTFFLCLSLLWLNDNSHFSSDTRNGKGRRTSYLYVKNNAQLDYRAQSVTGYATRFVTSLTNLIASHVIFSNTYNLLKKQKFGL
jgi:hypothetical protein